MCIVACNTHLVGAFDARNCGDAKIKKILYKVSDKKCDWVTEPIFRDCFFLQNFRVVFSVRFWAVFGLGFGLVSAPLNWRLFFCRDFCVVFREGNACWYHRVLAFVLPCLGTYSQNMLIGAKTTGERGLKSILWAFAWGKVVILTSR